MTYPICLNALHEAYRSLEEARKKSCEAAHALATVRETLSHVLEIAYQQQSFGPLNRLFDEEEIALGVYEQAVARVKAVEERWSAMSLALVYEKERLATGQEFSKRAR